MQRKEDTAPCVGVNSDRSILFAEGPQGLGPPRVLRQLVRHVGQGVFVLSFTSKILFVSIVPPLAHDLFSCAFLNLQTSGGWSGLVLLFPQ